MGLYGWFVHAWWDRGEHRQYIMHTCTPQASLLCLLTPPALKIGPSQSISQNFSGVLRQNPGLQPGTHRGSSELKRSPAAISDAHTQPTLCHTARGSLSVVLHSKQKSQRGPILAHSTSGRGTFDARGSIHWGAAGRAALTTKRGDAEQPHPKNFATIL